MSEKVSICMITYNHEKFIEQSIESVARQNTTFPYRLIIGEDCSGDQTANICEEYQHLYPEKIKLIRNQINLGMMSNFINTLSLCSGDYIAILEGDDYWIDDYKLQKQFDFMESNPDYAICFHNALVYDENLKVIVSDFSRKQYKDEYLIDDILIGNFIPTLTCFFRNNLIKEFPSWYWQAFPGDWLLHIFNSQFGKIRYIDEVMGVYRKNNGGICSKLDFYTKEFRYIESLKKLKSYLPHIYMKGIHSSILNIYKEILLYAYGHHNKDLFLYMLKTINYRILSKK